MNTVKERSVDVSYKKIQKEQRGLFVVRKM